jgi:hypothetical protein
MKLINERYMGWFFIVGMLLILLGCNVSSPNTVNQSSLKAITAFSLPSSNGPVNGTIAGLNIAVTMPFGTNVTALIATFTTTGQSVTVNGTPQVSGTTPNNFTNPLAYVVTAADGSTATYTVTVTVAAIPAKAITAFSLAGTPGTIIGQNIAVTMPFGTDITALIATFTTTGQSVTVNGTPQVSGTTPNNFTNPVAYLVTAADGSTATYSVTVTVAANPAKEITAFSLAGTPGTIIGQNIAVTMPFGTDVTALIAVFTTTGQNVTVNGTPQVSGATPNNFTNPVAYLVTAADGSTATYTVTVINNLRFAPYFPAGCTLGISCTCVQDTTTQDVWTVTTSNNDQCYNSLMDANGICADSTPLIKGYIPTLNNNNTCGFTDNGWNLPSQTQLTTMSNYVLAEPVGLKGTWFNNNGFSGIGNQLVYLGQCDGANCTLPSGTTGFAFYIDMHDGLINNDAEQNRGFNVAGWGVHSGQ